MPINLFKERELRFGRSLVPSIMESGNSENVMDMVPTVYYSQEQESMKGGTAEDGKMERSMYVSDIPPRGYKITKCNYTL